MERNLLQYCFGFIFLQLFQWLDGLCYTSTFSSKNRRLSMPDELLLVKVIIEFYLDEMDQNGQFLNLTSRSYSYLRLYSAIWNYKLEDCYTCSLHSHNSKFGCGNRKQGGGGKGCVRVHSC